MAAQIFNSESELQKWLSNALLHNNSFKELIANADEVTEMPVPNNMAASKILSSYKYCLESLNMVDILSENENISLKNGDVLKPDFILYAPETESIVIVELKYLVAPSRQAGTEVSAYASEIRSYIPFISDGDVINIVISTVWPTLLTHYVFHEIFWLQRNILCLMPIRVGNNIQLKIVDIETIANNSVVLKLSNEHLGGYRLCLYDDDLYKGGNRNRLDSHLAQMKTAMAAMCTKGNAQKNNGFAFLWKDNWELSIAPYNITIMNLAPFQSLERLFHDENFEPNQMTKNFIDVIQNHAPEGHGYSLETISKYGERFLEDVCSIRPEGFDLWEVHRRDITKQSELLSFHGWGIFGDLFADKLLNKYKQGHYSILPDDPQLGIALVDELVDPNYNFIDLHYWGVNPEEDDDFDE